MRQKSDVIVTLADLSKKEGVRYLHSGRFQSIITPNLCVVPIFARNTNNWSYKTKVIM